MVHQRRGSVSPAGCECRGVSVPWARAGTSWFRRGGEAGWAAYRSTGSGSRRRFLRALHDDSLFPDRALDKGAAILTAPRERIGARGRPASTPSTHSPTPRQRRSTRWRPGPRSGRQRDRDHRPRGGRRGVPAHRDGSRLPGRGPRTPRQRPGLVTAEAGGPAGLREAGVSHRWRAPATRAGRTASTVRASRRGPPRPTKPGRGCGPRLRVRAGGVVTGSGAIAGRRRPGPLPDGSAGGAAGRSEAAQCVTGSRHMGHINGPSGNRSGSPRSAKPRRR